MKGNNKTIVRRLLRSLLAGVLVFLFVMGAIAAPLEIAAATQEKDSVSRLIHVVYDDSTSMAQWYNTAWSEAKYSLEILSAMMQEKDVMNVYFMSDFKDGSTDHEPRIKNLSGDEAAKKKNISTIHEAVPDALGTYFQSIVKAYEDLQENSGNYDECHLVVITDGSSFGNYSYNGIEVSNKDGATSALNKMFSQNNGSGIRVVYLAIGKGAIVPKETDEGNVHVYEANPNDKSILNEVTRISERIFQRPEHPVSGDTLDLKIPVSELVIFAQGDNVSIGDIDGMKKSEASSKFTAADLDKFTAKPDDVDPYAEAMESKIKVAEGLSGTVATFTPSNGEYLDAGKIKLDVTATSYKVYYKPCLDVVLDIKHSDGNVVNDGDTVNVGKCTVDYYLTYPVSHPDYGKKVDLSGLDIDPFYTVFIEIDEQETDRKTGDGPCEFSLTPGKAVITVIAEYLTYISEAKSTAFTVEDNKVYGLKLTLTPESKEYVLSEMEEDTEGFNIKVTHDDGSALTDAEWNNCVLVLESEGVDFSEPEKNSDHSFTFFPRLKNGKYEDTGSGEIPFTATVTTEDEDGKDYKGTAEGTVIINNDVVAGENGFQVKVVDVTPDNLKSDNFNESAPEAHIEITWNGKPLSQAQYNGLTLDAAMKKELKVTDENGNETSLIVITGIELNPYVEGEPTSAVISFVANGDAETQRKNLAKYDNFTVIATLDMKGVVSQDTEDGTLGIARKWSIWDFILLIAIIALVLCYLVKGYLPFNTVKYNFRSVGGRMISDRKWLYANPIAIITLLIPLCPVISRMSFEVSVDGGTTVTVDVMGRPFHYNNVRLLNKEQLIQCNETVDTANMRTFKNNNPFINLTSARIRHNSVIVVSFKKR